MTPRQDQGDLSPPPRPGWTKKLVIFVGLIAATAAVTWLLVGVWHVEFTTEYWYVAITAGAITLFGATFVGVRWALRRARQAIDRPRRLPEEDRRS
ncbi:hypothetical protein OHA21_50400 [Actinoplanes sp. NBC_00393]|uniref:hypothetical protein n=1 Tax=Actinoplanes sp. NBC_00393 TaxID=2975953 RepID=UPI002E2160CC